MTEDFILNSTHNYISSVFGQDTAENSPILPWRKTDHLPFFLQNLYSYHTSTLFGVPCLFMHPLNTEGETPAVVKKHWIATGKHFDGNVIYLISTINSYNRKRLIDQNVPFIVPNNQLYLPPLGIDIREYFKSTKQVNLKTLSAPAQAILIREILHGDCNNLCAKDLALKTGYSSMTITRAYRDIVDKNIANIEKIGREKILSFYFSGKELWEHSFSVLQAPTTKFIWAILRDKKIDESKQLSTMAGESALSCYTSISSPNIKTIAIPSTTFSTLKKDCNIKILKQNPDEYHPLKQDQSVMKIEIWHYDPHITSSDENIVDPLSLWLSIKDIDDDRVEIAKDHLITKIWSK